MKKKIQTFNQRTSSKSSSLGTHFLNKFCLKKNVVRLFVYFVSHNASRHY